MKYNNNTRILYEGPSMIDQDHNIVCLISGLSTPTTNIKTGDMLQTFILLQDINPGVAVKEGKDSPICGSCKYKSGNGCYVQVWQAPNNMWKSYKAGRYKKFSKDDVPKLKNRSLRIGSYGDGAAVPYLIWYNMLKHVSGFTGYTHQAYDLDEKWQFLMASADTPGERLYLQSLGWRTFTTISELEEMSTDDIICPATPEGGNKTKCDTCRLCSGNKTKAKSIAVLLHGSDWVVQRAEKSRNKSLTLKN